MKESKLNSKNEQLKFDYKKYLKYVRQVKLKSDSVETKLSHIDDYDEFFNYQDFQNYTLDYGIKYYDNLKTRDISVGTMFSYLLDVYEFFEWLFRTHKIKNANKRIEELVSLKPRDEDSRLNNRLIFVEYPSREEFDKILDFQEISIRDKRDRAIIAFLFISCARVGAVASTTLECVDIDAMVYKQDPLLGVATKKQKHILTKLIPFGKQYTMIVADWIKYLKNEYAFTDKDPLFPKISNLAKGETVTKEFMSGEREFNEMLERRCKNAGFQKFNPHSFRHFGISEALKYVRTGTQLKALSQNVGHELLTNILEQYAKMKPDRYMSVVERMVSLDRVEKTVDELSDAELAEILRQRLASRDSY